LTPTFRVYLVTDRRRVPTGALAEALGRVLAGVPRGSVGVQLREKDLSPRELLPLAREVAAVCREVGAPLLVNDRVDVALAVGADGVHLAETSLPATEVRRLARREGWELLIGASVHEPAGLEAAARGADFAMLGPVHPTAGKAEPGRELGLDRLFGTVAGAPIPVYAVGGIDVGRVAGCRAAGAAGVAVISAVWDAGEPAAALGALVEVASKD